MLCDSRVPTTESAPIPTSSEAEWLSTVNVRLPACFSEKSGHLVQWKEGQRSRMSHLEAEAGLDDCHRYTRQPHAFHTSPVRRGR